jgi:3-hydroxypropanoate dehydrogenase
VTAIIAYDTVFWEQMHKLFPARPDMKNKLAAQPPESPRERQAAQSATLQAGYLILAARARSRLRSDGRHRSREVRRDLPCFLADGHWKSTLLVNLGYGDPARLHPRNPRLDFDDACRIV